MRKITYKHLVVATAMMASGCMYAEQLTVEQAMNRMNGHRHALPSTEWSAPD